MKALAILTVILFQICWVKSKFPPQFDSRLVKCIPVGNRDPNTFIEYNRLQIITNLIRTPLRDIAQFQIVTEDNPFYNQFITCSWKMYEYQTKQGNIMFDSIEMVLKDALIREVDATGPGINLSKIAAKKIVNECRDVHGYTAGHIAVKVQNCILKQLQHFAQF